MIEFIIDWFHHTFNPHCDLCNECKSCVTLKEQLNAERINNKKLIEAIINQLNPKEIIEPKPIDETREIKSPIPWKVRREMLEREDRINAELIRKNSEQVENAKNET